MTLSVLAKIMLGGLAVYGLLCVFMFLAQKAFLFHPSPERGAPADFGLSGFERIELATDDGETLVGWFHDSPKRDKAIVFFYGNADALPPYAAFFRDFASAGYSVLGLNYRGYGGSTGEPSETGFYRDGEAALAFLARSVPIERITVIGRSIGSGVAVELAARQRVGSLVLISPFTSIVDVASELFWYLPVRQLLRHRFSSIEKIGQVAVPVLIVHGDEDTLIPASHGKRLHEAANEPKRLEIFRGADHIGMDLDRIFELTLEFDAKRDGR